MKPLLNIGLAFCFCFLLISPSTAQILVIKKPHKPKIIVVKTSKPGLEYTWIDGHWIVKNNNYHWKKGHWVKARKHHIWIPGHWKEMRKGWKWIPGHWKKLRR